jgi:hypothetical protein
MKNTIKLLFLGLFLFGITASRAQIATSTGGAGMIVATVPITNNVGIGTTNPTGKLDVVGSTANVSLVANSATTANFRTSGYVQMAISTSSTSPFTTSLQAKHTSLDGIAYPIAINPLGGNVGIGTTTTSEKLTVAGNILAQVSLNFQDNTKFTVTNANVPSLTLTPFSMPKYGIAAPNTTGAADLWISGNNAIRMFTGSNPIPTVNILSDKVGIGTLNPDEKLTVNGTIHATEVKVTQTVPADYVFQKYYTGKSELKSDYTMPTLAEIENFTKKNHHLPNVPSAQEIQQKGVSLGEMSNVLLQKVEELTLYAIEQNKVIEELKTQVATLMDKKQ